MDHFWILERSPDPDDPGAVQVCKWCRVLHDSEDALKSCEPLPDAEVMDALQVLASDIPLGEKRKAIGRIAREIFDRRDHGFEAGHAFDREFEALGWRSDEVV